MIRLYLNGKLLLKKQRINCSNIHCSVVCRSHRSQHRGYWPQYLAIIYCSIGRIENFYFYNKRKSIKLLLYPFRVYRFGIIMYIIIIITIYVYLFNLKRNIDYKTITKQNHYSKNRIWINCHYSGYFIDFIIVWQIISDGQ